MGSVAELHRRIHNFQIISKYYNSGGVLARRADAKKKKTHQQSTRLTEANFIMIFQSTLLDARMGLRLYFDRKYTHIIFALLYVSYMHRYMLKRYL